MRIIFPRIAHPVPLPHLPRFFAHPRVVRFGSFRALCENEKKAPQEILRSFVLALPIFPGRLQPSIVSRNELNYCVRNGNRWTLTLISTNYVIRSPEKHPHYTVFFRPCQAGLHSTVRLPAHRKATLVHLQGFEPGTH